ncbi:MAG: hypothetical protein ACYC1L_01650 [Alphaproteobacteria bacterium]
MSNATIGLLNELRTVLSAGEMVAKRGGDGLGLIQDGGHIDAIVTRLVLKVGAAQAPTLAALHDMAADLAVDPDVELPRPPAIQDVH